MAPPRASASPAPDLAERLRRAALAEVPEHGWSDAALAAARRKLKLAPGAERLLVPGGGRGLLAGWCEEGAEAAAAALARSSVRGTTARVEAGVLALLAFAEAEPRLAERAAARLMLPDAAPLAARLHWRTADAIWRAVPDRSLDYNWYSKRLILAGVLARVLPFHALDRSPGKAQSRAFLKRELARAVSIGGRGGKLFARALAFPERAAGAFLRAGQARGAARGGRGG